MHFDYSQIPNYPEVDLIDKKYWKMTRDEYCILFDVVRKATEGKIGEIEMCELGAGDGASGAVFLLATQDMKPGVATLTSVDINSPAITRQAIKEANVSLSIAVDWEFRHRPIVTNTLTFQRESREHYAVTLVDAEHTYEESYRDIKWALECSDLVVAHDIWHPG